MISLTFDSDYVSENDMARFLEEFDFPGTATFFLHKPYSLSFGRHETQPHPFLKNTSEWEPQLEKLVSELGLKPTGIRTHSCAYTQPFGGYLAQRGYQYMSLATPLFQEGLAPYRHAWGIWELPIYYMDNLDFCMTKNWPTLKHLPFSPKLIEKAVHGNDLYLFDFHPLHIMLNTRRYEDYLAVRDKIISGENSAFNLACEGYGTRSFFLDLIRAMKSKGLASHSCAEVLAPLTENCEVEDFHLGRPTVDRQSPPEKGR